MGKYSCTDWLKSSFRVDIADIITIICIFALGIKYAQNVIKVIPPVCLAVHAVNNHDQNSAKTHILLFDFITILVNPHTCQHLSSNWSI